MWLSSYLTPAGASKTHRKVYHEIKDISASDIYGATQATGLYIYVTHIFFHYRYVHVTFFWGGLHLTGAFAGFGVHLLHADNSGLVLRDAALRGENRERLISKKHDILRRSWDHDTPPRSRRGTR